MNRTKSIWNPFFTHSKPSDLVTIAWLIFFGAIFVGLLENESTLAFCFGLVVGLSFMQLGFNWGQHQDRWFRFFFKHRSIIFEHGYSSKGQALMFLVALAVSKMLRVVLSLSFLFALLALSDFFFPGHWRSGVWILELLVFTFITAAAAHALSKRAEAWGEAKLFKLRDYSYVFDADQEKITSEKQ